MNRNEIIVDEDLLDEFQVEASEEAFRRIVDRFAGLVFGVAMRRAGDHQMAEEISQNVFLILSHKAGRLESRNLAGWLHRTTVLESRNMMRKEANRKRTMEALTESLDPEEVHHDATVTMNETRQFLDQAINALSVHDRDGILMRYFEGRKHQEIGAILGKSEEAIRKQLERSLEKLNRFLQRKGVVLTGVALGSVLTSEMAKAAPAGLSHSISTGIVSGTRTITATKLLLHTYQSVNWSKGFVSSTVGAISVAAIVSVIAVVTGVGDDELMIEELIKLSKARSNEAFEKAVGEEGYRFIRTEGVPEVHVYHSEKEFEADATMKLFRPNVCSYSSPNGQTTVEFITVDSSQFKSLAEQMEAMALGFAKSTVKAHPVMEGTVTTYLSEKMANIRITVSEVLMTETGERQASWKSYHVTVNGNAP